jgi:hypothetical protein
MDWAFKTVPQKYSTKGMKNNVSYFSYSFAGIPRSSSKILEILDES